MLDKKQKAVLESIVRGSIQQSLQKPQTNFQIPEYESIVSESREIALNEGVGLSILNVLKRTFSTVGGGVAGAGVGFISTGVLFAAANAIIGAISGGGLNIIDPRIFFLMGGAQVATTLLGAYKGSKLGYLMSKNNNTEAEKDLIEILNIVDGRDRLIVKMLEEIEKATIKNPQITEEEMAKVVFSYDARIERLTSEMVRKANQFKQSHLSNPSLPKREEISKIIDHAADGSLTFISKEKFQ